MANGHGGRRAGSGRKPKAITVIKRMAIEQAGEDAEKSLGFLIEVRDRVDVDLSLRVDCAKEVMDRVWGKAKQRTETDVSAAIRVVLDE